MAIGDTQTVEYLNNERPDLKFVSDSQDVESVKNALRTNGAADYFLTAFDSFFVAVGEGEYTEVWGMEGIFPAFEKIVSRLL